MVLAQPAQGSSLSLRSEALAEALKDANIAVISHPNTAAAALWQVAHYRPDVVVIDFGVSATGDATRLASEVRSRHPDVAVLVLAEIIQIHAARALLGAGSTRVGYLLKNRLSGDGFVSALRRIASGATAMDPAIVPHLLGHRDHDDALGQLTPRERDVLELIADGLSNGAIADELVITKRAVEKDVKSIFAKVLVGAPPERERRVLAALAFRAARERTIPPRAAITGNPIGDHNHPSGH